MALGHERLDVYRLSISYVAWVYEKASKLTGIHRNAREQWLRASQSIPLNIAEGNGKTAKADRRRYFEIARGSALECAAIQDVLVVGKAIEEEESQQRKAELDRIVAMLSRLAVEGTKFKRSQRPTESIPIAIPIPIPIAIAIAIAIAILIAINLNSSPSKVFEETLDSAPERRTSASSVDLASGTLACRVIKSGLCSFAPLVPRREVL